MDIPGRTMRLPTSGALLTPTRRQPSWVPEKRGLTPFLRPKTRGTELGTPSRWRRLGPATESQQSDKTEAEQSQCRRLGDNRHVQRSVSIQSAAAHQGTVKAQIRQVTQSGRSNSP